MWIDPPSSTSNFDSSQDSTSLRMVVRTGDVATLPSIKVRLSAAPMAEVLGNAPMAKSKFSWGQFAKNSFNSRRPMEPPASSPRVITDDGPQSPRTPRKPTELSEIKSPPKSPPKSPKSFFSSKAQVMDSG